MSLPFNITLPLWSAQASSLTSTWNAHSEAFRIGLFGQVKLTILTSTFSGSISFQSSADGSTWFDLPNLRSDTDAALALGLVDGQPQFVLDTSSRTYIVPGGPWPHFRIVLTVDQGSITGTVQGFEHDSGFIGSR